MSPTTSSHVTTLLVAEMHARMRAQGVSNRQHIAFVCPVCGTIQSIASLVLAGCTPVAAERAIGFSCEGRFSNAGPWPGSQDNSPQAKARRFIRGCDWTLGGLFQIHKLEVILADGTMQPVFELATADQAQQLERDLTTANAVRTDLFSAFNHPANQA